MRSLLQFNIALQRIEEVYNRVISFRQYLSLLSGLCLVLFFFSGCAGFGKRLEPPRIALANIQVKEVKILESVFQIDLRIFNTNEVPLDVKGIEYKIAGRLRLGAGAMPAVIPFKSSGEVSLEGIAGYR